MAGTLNSKSSSRLGGAPLLRAIVLGLSIAASAFAAESTSARLVEELLRDPTPDEWASLQRFDATLTRADFESRLDRPFDPTRGLRPFLAVNDSGFALFSGADHHGTPVVSLHFARAGGPMVARPVSFRSPEQFQSGRAPANRLPLAGLRVAIEPADIGGKWAKIEDRSVYFKGFGQISEGDLNLAVAKRLSADLSKLGASPFLARTSDEPVCGLTVADVLPFTPGILKTRPWLMPEAYVIRYPNPRALGPEQLQFAAGLILTKSLETRARAAYIRRSFRPDITLVLQHNATNGSTDGRLTPVNRNIFFVDGAFSGTELKEGEQRFRLLTKVLEDVTPIETKVAAAISERFKIRTGFQPVLYGNSANTVLVIPQNPYVVARNLAFNREHDGPVVVTEPYFMNQADTLARLKAGDFEGQRTILGKRQTSIVREYADCVAEGIANAYR